MDDFLVGVGLALVFEGVIWAAFPGLALRAAISAAQSPPWMLRASALIVLAIGLAMVWSVRG
ncbi:MAG: DUF2065 domain-containing protein [Pseudomonadota bacterium]